MSQVEIGRVVKPHGIRGEVGVLLHQPESDLLEHLSELTLQLQAGESQLIRLERVAKMGKGYRVKFPGFDDRDSAERLRGATLWVAREALPKLEGDEQYLVDLVGVRVFGPDGAPFGSVVEVLTYPSVDSLVIEKLDGSRVEQPLVDAFAEVVHAGETTIALRSLEGLL